MPSKPTSQKSREEDKENNDKTKEEYVENSKIRNVREQKM